MIFFIENLVEEAGRRNTLIHTFDDVNRHGWSRYDVGVVEERRWIWTQKNFVLVSGSIRSRPVLACAALWSTYNETGCNALTQWLCIGRWIVGIGTHHVVTQKKKYTKQRYFFKADTHGELLCPIGCNYYVKTELNHRSEGVECRDRKLCH